MMTFDPCPHKVTQVVLAAGRVIRRLQGLPEERNITRLYEYTAPLLGLDPIQEGMTSRHADHLPSPAEMRNKEGGFILPRRECPKCGAKEALILAPLCQSCKDAEGGKYKSIWTCIQCGFKEKLEKWFIQILTELGIDLPQGDKQAMGIKTMTDEGLK